ncbi:PREDICTED: uncharacterized abhydrolase domain-containing protein DDB_G0269086-like [Brassica oleracea var. oleracea]|uniref:uncharacterized abhydrolase domain-containing protein DDB_G0269086-like n=1 Tax=Brassica oleracea var. oleracea TaxID=109376 RepID=UPI0006A73F1D|nr:PREDICTED: uncharacterized abhydrolase domain-containing protein DDB_G0269086-like [Brassica oleracea var. oleracea]
MDGVPNMSVLLKGKLQLLTKKSIPADEGAPGLVREDVGAEPSASGPKKKKKSKKSRRKATEELPLEEIASLDETSEGLEARKKKGEYEGATSSADHGEAPAVGREGAAEGPFESNHSVAAPEDRLRKKKKKRSIEAEPRRSGAEAGLVEVVAGGGVSLETPPEGRKVSARGSDPVASERSVPDPSARKGSRSEGSTVHGVDAPNSLWDEGVATIGRPLLKERSDGSMNFLVEKYDNTLKQTMIQLGSSEKLAQARLKAIERVRAEGKLKSARATRKELVRENNRLEQAAANLEKEKTELVEERDTAVVKLIRERQRLRDSRGLEVTRERERVEAAMVEKASRRFDRVRDHFTRLEAFEKTKNLYAQASGTKKCLEVIKAGGTEIPQEMIDVFAEQEKLYEAGVSKLRVGPLSDSDLTLSPLGRFLSSSPRSKLPRSDRRNHMVDVTSVPAEHVGVPEGGGPGERPENENLEEVPGKDNPEMGNTPVQEEETGNVGIEDPVLVSDSSSEGREGEEEEDDRVEETSSLQPVEEEKPDEVGNRDVPPPLAVDSLVSISAQVEDPTVAATEDPVGPSALGAPEEVGQDSAP